MPEVTSRDGSTAPPASEGELPTPDVMRQASSAEILDEQGHKTTFGEVCRGKRTVVVFIRHFCLFLFLTLRYFHPPFHALDLRPDDVVLAPRGVLAYWLTDVGCLNCQAYVSQLGKAVPPADLPEGTQVIVIGCGSHQPIRQYAEASHSPYAIYANPSLSLYTSFNFVSNFGMSKKGEEKEYEKDLGSSMNRLWQALAQGPVKHFEHVNYVGPKGQNGGELIVESDGRCSFFHRMRHTADHVELKDLAKAVGAEYSPSTES